MVLSVDSCLFKVDCLTEVNSKINARKTKTFILYVRVNFVLVNGYIAFS